MLLALILALGLASLVIGPAPIPLATAAKALFVGQGSAGIMVRDIRLPRTLLAIMIGGMFGRPGRRCRACCATRSPIRRLRRPAGGGARRRAGALFRLAGACPSRCRSPRSSARSSRSRWSSRSRDATPTVVLVLAGLAIGSLAGAATSLAISLSPNPFAITEIVFWLLGSLEDRSMVHVVLAAPFIRRRDGCCCSTTGRALRALSLGEETARASASTWRGRGSHRRRERHRDRGVGRGGRRDRLRRPRGAASRAAALGYDPARTLVPATLAGAALLLAADCAVRLIPSGAEVRIGVLTALLGVPVFLWIIARRRGELADVAA